MKEAITTYGPILISIMALLYSIVATRVASRALKLSEHQEKRKLPNLTVYRIDAFIKRLEEGHIRIFVFHVNINNIADVENSIRCIEFMIEYEKAGIRSDVIIKHDANLINFIKRDSNSSAFQLPARIAAHDTLEGYALFELDEHLLKGIRTDSYILRITDTHGIEFCHEAILLCEV